MSEQGKTPDESDFFPNKNPQNKRDAPKKSIIIRNAILILPFNRE
jgi:hypothetical protein